MRSAIFAILAGALSAQTTAPPVPPWPADNRPPRNIRGNYVFLDRSTSTIVIVIPGSLRGEPDQPPEIIRVPYLNRFDPEAAVSVARATPDKYRYSYSVANGKSAKDPVHGWTIATSCGDPLLKIEAWPLGWHCTKIEHAMAMHQFALPYLKGNGCSVVCFVNGVQPPDSLRDQIALLSGLRPGFTTASAENYPPFKVSFDWPETILEQQQLIVLGSPEWANKHTVTLGPRFRADVGAPRIAEDFLQGLSQLVRVGRLTGDSEFIERLRAALARAAETGRLDTARLGTPTTELEREVIGAVKLDLAPDSR